MTGTRRHHWCFPKTVRWFLVAVLIIVFTAPNLATMRPESVSASPAPGATAIVDTDALNVRSAPGTNNPVVRVLNQGAPVTVSGATVMADGLEWAPIGSNGWVAATYLQTTGILPDTFEAGDRVLVDAGAVNFRVDAGTSARVIRPLPYGTVLRITGGPVDANGYTWYQAKTTTATGEETGWVIGEAFTPAPGEMPDPGVLYGSGTAVHVATDLLRLRSDASIASSTLATLPDGTPLTVIAAPIGADGHTWYPVRTASGTTGWVAEAYIAGGSASTPATITPGSPAVVNDGPLNFRSGPGLDHGVQAELPTGTWLMIVSGPQPAGGYNWYEVDTSDGRSGWVIGEALVPSS